jgi:hypothetical protein
MALKISSQPVAGSIIVNANKECALDVVLIINKPNQIYTDLDPRIRF